MQLPFKPNRRAIRIVTGVVSGELNGRFGFSFSGSAIQFDANANRMTGEICTQTLKQMKSFGEATCEREVAESDGSGSYVITIDSFPVLPHENNIFTHNGNPSISAFRCNMTDTFHLGAVNPYCSITDVETEDIPPYLECAGHGTCDMVSGSCSCQRGFHGLACDDTADNDDIFTRFHDGPFFTGSIVKLVATKARSTDFSYLRIMNGANNALVNVTTIQGDGRFINEAEIESRSGFLSDIPLKGSSKSRATSAHFRAVLGGQEVFTVSADGDLVTSGPILAANNTFLAENGLVTMDNAAVEGKLHVAQQFTVGSTLRVSPAGLGATFTSDKGKALEINALHKKFNGTVLDLEVSSSDATLLKATVNGQTRLEISAMGVMEVAGMRLRTGGLAVDTGGALIKGGGLSVHGGLTVHSGGLHLPYQEFSSNHIEATNEGAGHDSAACTASSKGLLRARNTLASFGGSLLDLESESAGNGKFFYIRAGTSSGNAFSVADDGSVISRGSVQIKAGLDVGGAAVLGGGVRMAKVTVSAGPVILIPQNAAYVEIKDDGKTEANIAQFEVSGEGAIGTLYPGQIVVISNTDAQVVKLADPSGSEVLPGMIVMFIFNGFMWKSVDALSAPMTIIKDVRSLVAAADLNIGNFTFAAGHLRASELPVGHVLTSGVDGLLTTAPGLTWSKGMLSVPALKLNKLLTDVDVRGNVLKNAIIVDSKISADELRLTGITRGGGIAVFDASGTLGLDQRVQLTPDGSVRMEKAIFGQAAIEGKLDVGANFTSAHANIMSLSVSQNVSVVGDIASNQVTTQVVNAQRVLADTAVFVRAELGSASAAELNVASGTISGKRLVADDAEIKSVTARNATFETSLLGSSQASALTVSGTLEVAGSLTTSGALEAAGPLTLGDLSKSLDASPIGVDAAGKVVLQTYDNLAHKLSPLISLPDKASFQALQVSSNIRTFNMTTNALQATNIISSIGSIAELRSNTLAVTADTELHGDVFIHSSLTVQGTVVGSGPYVDSSDARFKKNVIPLKQSLDKVCALNGVSYEMRTNEFPNKNFSNGTTIGWIAQEVEKVVPELVMEDTEGFKAVAYARSVALLGNAIAELRQEMQQELKKLQDEIAALKAELAKRS